MSKPWIHAESSALKYGGTPKDYIAIHDMMDSSKSAEPTFRHRAIFHSAFGIFLIEKIFGHNITNSENNLISVRDIAEQHVLEDLGKIPTLSDWLSEIPEKPFMQNQDNMFKLSNETIEKLFAPETGPDIHLHPLQPTEMDKRSFKTFKRHLDVID